MRTLIMVIGFLVILITIMNVKRERIDHLHYHLANIFYIDECELGYKKKENGKSTSLGSKGQIRTWFA